MKRLLALFLLCAPSAWAQCAGGGTKNLPDLQPSTLQNCLNSVNTDNTTVVLPAGSIAWTTAVSATLTNSVIIQGAGAISATTGGASTTGTDKTTILDHVNHGGGGSNQSLDLSTTSGKSLRITGIAFTQDSTSQSANNGIIAIGGNSTSVRLDHCHFNMVIFSHELNLTGVYGVADHNYFQGTGGVGGLYFEYAGSDGLGDDAWHQADQWGTVNFFYVEDNLFDDHGDTDSHSGARYVFRYNNTIARQSHTPSMANHGIHDRARSSRAIEVYNNTWTSVLSSGNGGPTTSNNGGGEIYWGNTINGYQRAFDVDYTCKDTSTYAQCGVAPPNAWGLCNTTTGNGWDQNASPPNGYACIDGPGRGQGDQISGSFPTVCNITLNPACNIFTGQWPREAISPIYLWMNNYTPASGFGTVTFLGNSGVVNNNRDYYMQFGPNGANPGSFTGATGTGFGLLSARPATCTAGLGGNTTGVGYWATNAANPQDPAHPGVLYTCNPTNTWTVYYTPYIYPHPLTTSGSSAPVLSFSPSPVNFPNQNVGTTSAPLTITVTNTGTAAEVLATPYFTITGTDASNFANTGTGNCVAGATIAVSGSCTVNVTFTPSPTGLRSAVLTILGTVSGTVSLQGTGTSPVLSLTPNPLAFGNQTISTTSPPLTITTSNTGTGPEVLLTPHYTNSNATEFLRTGGSCADAASIPPGSNCTDIFSFKPSAIGARSGTFTIRGTINGTDSMTGTGTAVAIPVVQLGPRTVNFGTVNTGNSSLPITFTLQNTGTATLNITSISSSDTIQFPISTQLCGATLAPSATCTFADSCQPSTATSLNAIITVSTNASSSPDLITLACTGATPPVNPPPAPAPVIFIGSTLPAQPIVSNVGLTAPCPMNNRCTYVMSCTQCSALTQLYIDNVLTAQNYFNGTMTYTIKLVAGTHSYLAVNLQ